MAYANRVITIPGLTASADLSAHQHKFVVDSPTGTALAGDGVNALGIQQDKPAAAGRPTEVATVGSVSKLILAATIAKGAPVASDASGEGKVPASGNYIVCEALEGGDAGDIISVLITKAGRVA